jgi:hypothetical protein
MHKLKAGSDPGLFSFAVAAICSVVIVREGGRSSTPRLLGSIAGDNDYWMPAFAGHDSSFEGRNYSAACAAPSVG